MLQLHINALHNLIAASDEKVRLYRSDWCRTYDLSGTRKERSSRVLLQLVKAGLAECERNSGSFRQSQYIWRPTEAGRALAAKNCFTYDG
jgi:hypothetical protein